MERHDEGDPRDESERPRVHAREGEPIKQARRDRRRIREWGRQGQSQPRKTRHSAGPLGFIPSNCTSKTRVEFAGIPGRPPGP